MDVIIKALADSGNQAVLSLLIANGALLLILRDVHRAQKDAMDKLTEVITQLRVELSRGRK
jgi:hypothetical protein